MSLRHAPADDTAPVAAGTTRPTVPVTESDPGDGGASSVPVVSVLLVAEATYPYHFGGVSTWCHTLLGSLPDATFHLVTISDRPNKRSRFALPANVASHRDRPIWGVRLNGSLRAWYREVARPGRPPDEGLAEFVRAYRSFLDQMFGPTLEVEVAAEAIHAMHRHYLEHGYDAVMRSRAVWDVSHRALARHLAVLGQERVPDPVVPTLADVADLTNAVRHWLMVLAEPLPPTAVVHTAMAGLCTLVAVAAQREHGARFLMSEHGVFLREVYLAESKLAPSVLTLARVRWAERTTQLTYALADQISPCCDFNQRWETRIGADPAKLHTIYYGMDGEVFTPAPRPADAPPRVVWTGRINPLKDVETLLRAAALVVRERPDAVFLLFGSASEDDQAYEARCRALWHELGLEDHVVFRGYTDRPQDAYNEGDVVVLPSISEGFPNSTLEAMLCGRPVVASDVGGLPEQIGPTGILFEPRNARALADAVLALLDDPVARERLGRAARERAATSFTIARLRDEHVRSYDSLTSGLGPCPAKGTPEGARSLRVEVRHDAATGEVERVIVEDGGDLPSPVTPPARTEPLEPLVDEVGRRAVGLVGSLQTAAVLESLGVGDRTARQRYGCGDVFALADAVLAELRRRDDALSGPLEHRGRLGRDAGTHRPWHRGLAAVVLAYTVLAIVRLAQVFGEWEPLRTVAFGLGISIGAAAANGVVLAVSRPLAFYRAAEDIPLARRALQRMVPGAVAAALAVGAVVVGFAAVSPALDPGEVRVLAAGYGGACLLLTLIGIAGLVGEVAKAVAPAVVGLAVLIVADRALVHVTASHLAVAGALALGVATVLAVVVVRRALAEGPAVPGEGAVRRAVDSRDWVTYFCCGVLALAPLLLPHLLAWGGRAAGTAEWEPAFLAFERASVVALLPLLLSVGVADAELRQFWRLLPMALAWTRAGREQSLGVELQAFADASHRRYLSRLAVLCAVTFVGYSLVVARTGEAVVPRDQVGWSILSIGACCLASLLMGSGAFRSMYCLALGRPRGVLRSLVVAVGAVGALAYPLALAWSWRVALPALVLAPAVYAVAAGRDHRVVVRGTPALYSAVS